MTYFDREVDQATYRVCATWLESSKVDFGSIAGNHTKVNSQLDETSSMKRLVQLNEQIRSTYFWSKVVPVIGVVASLTLLVIGAAFHSLAVLGFTIAGTYLLRKRVSSLQNAKAAAYLSAVKLGFFKQTSEFLSEFFPHVKMTKHKDNFSSCLSKLIAGAPRETATLFAEHLSSKKREMRAFLSFVTFIPNCEREESGEKAVRDAMPEWMRKILCS